MSIERLTQLLTNFRQQVAGAARRDSSAGHTLDTETARGLLESMLLSRHLDAAALALRMRGVGHYTIGSSGHEGNAVLGRLTRPSDPSLVHYRSGALQLERARQVPGIDGVRDIALSLVASSEEPVSSGRHKLFGGKSLGIIPQTSTIASHLPRAVGLAYALAWKQQQRLAEHPADALVLCSFGDASINHSTALGAFNAASWVTHQSLPLPLLFVCEDNGLGVSVRSPPGWVETRLRAMPHLKYFAADTSDLEGTWVEACAAVRHCRETRRPAILHLTCVRLLGHAGSDVDATYRSRQELEQAAKRDPLLCAALSLVASGTLTPSELLELDARAESRVEAEAARAAGRPRLTSRAQVAASLARAIPPGFTAKERSSARPSESMTLAQGVTFALREMLSNDPGTLLFGEDVAKKGGV
ncbi:MAG TPA: thiamine pyrophosphate-dependent enzyme, partial [Polyangiaceae bacterium]|nr:thiamine pyrophosphate-dependent enzyme [Polyangiaceae bacterium]